MGAVKKYFKPVFTIGLRLLFTHGKYRRMAIHPEKYPYEYRYEQAIKIIKYCTKCFNVEFRVEGIDKLPEENVLFAVNHQSVFDPFISQLFDKKTVWIAKKEIEKFPFIGNIAKSIETIFFQREEPREAVKMIRKANEALQSGRSVWMSMEGTRSKKEDHSMNEFLPGSLKPAYTNKTTIVPLVICGTWKVFSTHYCKKPLYIDVCFFDPIKYEDYKDMNTMELSDKLYKMMKKKDDEYLEWHNKN